MKKIQCVVCAAVAVLVVSACGGSTPEAESASNASEAREEPGANDNLSDDEFWAQEEEKSGGDGASADGESADGESEEEDASEEEE